MRVAIVGCGQLARMLALAGWPLGLRFSFLTDANDNTDGVRGLGEIVLHQAAMSPAELFDALGQPDVITVEKEAVDTELLRALKQFCPVHPDPDAIYECQNRRRQKQRLNALEIPNTPHKFAQDAQSLAAATLQLDMPVIVKSAEHGYDGKNQWQVSKSGDLDSVCTAQQSGDWIVEKKMAFERELSLLAVRSTQGEIRFYPPTQNLHVQGILRSSIAPAQQVDPAKLEQMQQHLSNLLEHWHYVGVIAMECFVVDGNLLVNELAPRVHNSGHWTQQSDATSQFENHLRAIIGWPLGNTQPSTHSAMLNLVGVAPSTATTLSDIATLHWYNKSLRPNRKLGHINLQAGNRQQVESELERLSANIYGDNAQ